MFTVSEVLFSSAVFAGLTKLCKILFSAHSLTQSLTHFSIIKMPYIYFINANLSFFCLRLIAPDAIVTCFPLFSILCFHFGVCSIFWSSRLCWKVTTKDKTKMSGSIQSSCLRLCLWNWCALWYFVKCLKTVTHFNWLGLSIALSSFLSFCL